MFLPFADHLEKLWWQQTLWSAHSPHVCADLMDELQSLKLMVLPTQKRWKRGSQRDRKP